MRLLLLSLFFDGFPAHKAAAVDYPKAPNFQPQGIPENSTEWELRLTQLERNQYLNILKREQQRLFLGFAAGVGGSLIAPAAISLPLAVASLPLVLTAAVGPAAFGSSALALTVILGLTNALIQTRATHWMLNQSRYYQFKMMPGFLANLVGQGVSAALMMSLTGLASAPFWDPALAWQTGDLINEDRALGSLNILGALLVSGLTYALLPPLMGTWAMSKYAKVRPGFRPVRPAPARSAAGTSGIPPSMQAPLLRASF